MAAYKKSVLVETISVLNMFIKPQIICILRNSMIFILELCALIVSFSTILANNPLMMWYVSINKSLNQSSSVQSTHMFLQWVFPNKKCQLIWLTGSELAIKSNVVHQDYFPYGGHLDISRRHAQNNTQLFSGMMAVIIRAVTWWRHQMEAFSA